MLDDVAKRDLGGLGEAADEVEHLTEEAGYGRWRPGWYTHSCGDGVSGQISPSPP